MRKSNKAISLGLVAATLVASLIAATPAAAWGRGWKLAKPLKLGDIYLYVTLRVPWENVMCSGEPCVRHQ